MPGKHARLSPSDADRWMACPISVQLTEEMEEGETREYAAEGTVAHKIHEMCIQFGLDAYDFIGKRMGSEGYVFDIDEEWADHLQPGIDRVREFEGPVFVELLVDTSKWCGPGNFGTLDTGIAGAVEIVIKDLKYGRGIAVPAVDIKQLRIYGLAFWDQVARHITDATQFRFIVDQPRNSAGGGEWLVSLEDLLAFGEEVKVAAKRTLDPNAKACPGEKQCTWCKAAKIDGMCPPHEAWKLSIPGNITFENLDEWDELGVMPILPKIAGITPERRRYINENAHVFIRWLKRLHADELLDALEGRSTPGAKAVDGRRPPRKWRDQTAAEAYLGRRLPIADIFTKKLISPAQAEGKLGKAVEIPETLVDKGLPKPVLVSIKDDRPAVRRSGHQFDNLDDEPTDND